MLVSEGSSESKSEQAANTLPKLIITASSVYSAMYVIIAAVNFVSTFPGAIASSRYVSLLCNKKLLVLDCRVVHGSFSSSFSRQKEGREWTRAVECPSKEWLSSSCLLILLFEMLNGFYIFKYLFFVRKIKTLFFFCFSMQSHNSSLIYIFEC